MALSTREDQLLTAAFGDQGGDSAVRDAVVGFIADKFGFSRSGGSPTGVLQVAGSGPKGVVTTPATTVVEEHGDGLWHYTKLTFTAFALGLGGDAEDLAIGAKFYTFPAGTILVEDASLVGTFDQTSHGTVTDGECGIGTVIGSGAVDTLGEVGSTSENVIEGDVGVLSTYVLGTGVVQIADRAGLTAQVLTILSAGVHDLFLNLAATWPNIAEAEAVTFTGVATLKWRKVS